MSVVGSSALAACSPGCDEVAERAYRDLSQTEELLAVGDHKCVAIHFQI
jgi:hypothetical protein